MIRLADVFDGSSTVPSRSPAKSTVPTLGRSPDRSCACRSASTRRRSSESPAHCALTISARFDGSLASTAARKTASSRVGLTGTNAHLLRDPYFHASFAKRSVKTSTFFHVRAVIMQVTRRESHISRRFAPENGSVRRGCARDRPAATLWRTSTFGEHDRRSRRGMPPRFRGSHRKSDAFRRSARPGGPRPRAA
jgi:hypothetical protein